MKEKDFKLLVLPPPGNMQQVVAMFPFPIKLSKGKLGDLEMIFQDGQTKILHKGTDLKEFSFVWLSSSWRTRDLAFAVQTYLKQNKIPSTYVEKGTSKLTDHMIFSLSGISSPNTLFLGRKEVKNNLEKIESVCGFPLVIKDTKGSRGTHSSKVKTKEELIKKTRKLPSYKKFIFQQYIPNDYDWGVMVANGKVVSGERSYSCEGEFRNNVCNGAEEVFVDPAEIPEHIKKMAIQASESLGLVWSRSDIIVDKDSGEPFVLEVNRFPGITAKTSEVDGAYAFLSSQVKAIGEVGPV